MNLDGRSRDLPSTRPHEYRTCRVFQHKVTIGTYGSPQSFWRDRLSGVGVTTSVQPVENCSYSHGCFVAFSVLPSQVTPRDRLSHPLPSQHFVPFLLLVFSLPLSLNLSLKSIKQYKPFRPRSYFTETRDTARFACSLRFPINLNTAIAYKSLEIGIPVSQRTCGTGDFT